jgi:tRNA G10  N-methylase Trm11
MNNRPLSAGYWDDGEILDTLLGIHSPCDNPIIMDTTYNSGKMWKKCSHKPNITMDIDPKYRTTIVGDFKKIPVEDKSVDVIVFDPPHLTSDGDSEHSSKIYKECYGITKDDKDRDGLNVSKIFAPFLKEALRILKPKGVILAKIADLVHSGKYQFQHVDLINEAKSMGFNVDDLLIKVRKSVLMSSKWKTIQHLRKNHCYWVVIKKP